MALGYTASFSTSHIRPYTGPTGPDGGFLTGTGGFAGATSATGSTGPRGITGVTGFSIVGTYLQDDPSKPAYGYYVLRFSDSAGNEVTAAPRGLTGEAGPVQGAFPNVYNRDVGTTGVFIGITKGTLSGHANPPYFGVCGSTLTFRRIGVSGDLVFYTDLVNIGTGPTYSVLGISGPNSTELYGTVTGQSVGELAYLQDQRNARDAHGLTFTDKNDGIFASIIPPQAGSAEKGLTWGTISPKFYNTTNFYHVHGNEVSGVVKNPFNIHNEQGSVHLVYAPFTLNNITVKENSKVPISVSPHWVTQRTQLFGSTAEYGEAHQATLIVKNGPDGISFSNRFYFDQNNNTFSDGVNVVSCLSYDDAESWLCSVVGKHYNVRGGDVVTYGSCCDSTVSFLCDDFIANIECEERGGSFEFYPDTPCTSTPCALTDVEGSCCLNKDENEVTICIDSTNSSGIPITAEFCQRFGGSFRPLIQCDPINYPCDPDVCDEDFGIGGACCEFTIPDGNYLQCTDNLTADDCFVKGEESDTSYTVYQGDGTYCVNINCCDSLTKRGSCCLGEGLCTDDRLPEECTELGGIYMGHNTTCATTPCVCDAPYEEDKIATIGSCCTMNLGQDCCIENQIEENCSLPGMAFYPNKNCDESCPDFSKDCNDPLNQTPRGKCCKNCSACSDHDFTCNDLWIEGGCGNWNILNQQHTNSNEWCGGPNITDPSSQYNDLIFGGFPTCSCADNITQDACKILFGSDANWTQGQSCHIREGQSICSDPNFGVGTCCLPRFNNNPVGGFDFDAVDCSYPASDGVVGTCNDWECTSCQNARECAAQVLDYYPLGSIIFGERKEFNNRQFMITHLENIFVNYDYGPIVEQGGNGNQQPYFRSYGNCSGDQCPRIQCGGCPNVGTGSPDFIANPNTRCGYCSTFMSDPNFIDDSNQPTPAVICPP